MTTSTWLFYGDEHIQSMYRYMRDPIAGRVVADVIGSANSDYRQWATCGGNPCTGGSRTVTEIYVDDVKPPVVVLALGSNPAASANGAKTGVPADFTAHVREVLRLSRKHGAQVLVVGPFANDPGGKRLTVLRGLVPDAIDGAALASGLPRAADGVHFTEEGYRTLAERMISALFAAYQNRAKPTTTPGTGLPTGLPTGTTSATEEAAAAASWIEQEASPGPTGTEKSTRPAYVVPLLVTGGLLAVGGFLYAVAAARRRR